MRKLLKMAVESLMTDFDMTSRDPITCMIFTIFTPIQNTEPARTAKNKGKFINFPYSFTNISTLLNIGCVIIAL